MAGCALQAPRQSASSNAQPPHAVFLIADTDFHQEGDPDDVLRGAILAFDPKTKECSVFAADKQFLEPQGIVRHSDGSLLVVDFGAKAKPDSPDSPHAKGTGAIFRLSGKDGSFLRRYDSELFVAPTSLVLVDDHTAWISDRKAKNAAGGQGAVLALDLESGATKVAFDDARFKAPSCLALSKLGKPVLCDADAKRDATTTDEGVLFRLDAATSKAEPFAYLTGTLSPLGLLCLDDGDCLIFDSNADPKHLGGPAGAVFRQVAATGKTEVLAELPRFRDPVRGAFGPDGRVWFVDANADPEKRGPDRAGRGQNATGPGAIFAIDLATNAVETIASPLCFVNPVAILWVP